MTLIDILDRRVRARKEEDDIEDPEDVQPEAESEGEEIGSTTSESEDGTKNINDQGGSSNEEDEDDDEDSIHSSAPAPDPQYSLSHISFGALASAQASLSQKRKHDAESSRPRKRVRSPSPFHEASERRAGKKLSVTSTRTSKHAPTELSAKKAVSRKRSVISVPTIAPRDPRFSSLSGPLDTHSTAQNYAFLNSYRASEISALKAQIKSTRDPDAKEQLRKQVRAMEDRERARERKETEKGVLREHRKEERKRVEGGKKPFYLKKGEVKKRALVKRFEGLGEKKAEKVVERRRRKRAGQERREMPRGRREG